MAIQLQEKYVVNQDKRIFLNIPNIRDLFGRVYMCSHLLFQKTSGRVNYAAVLGSKKKLLHLSSRVY